MFLTKDDIKKYVEHKIRTNSTKLVPRSEEWIIKNVLLKESIDYHCKEFIGNISYCEKLRHILLDLSEQHICPVCKIDIPLKRDCCSFKCAGRNPIRKAKIKKTNNEKYGADNWIATEEGRKFISETKLNYSEDKKKEILSKREQTNIEKYGTPYLLQQEVYKEKAKETFIEKYGVDNPRKNKDVIDKIYNTKKDNDKKYPERMIERKLKIKIKRFKANFKKGYYHYEGSIPLFTENDHHLEQSEMKYKCSTCNTEFFRYSSAITRCIECHPVRVSQPEIDLIDYITKLGFDPIRGSKKVIYPYEIDIFLETKNLAIEYDGLAYHSFGRSDVWPAVLDNHDKEDKNYHLMKTNLCKEKDIQLLHIFENEWLDETKRKIWESMIKTKLGCSERIFARKCKIKELSSKDVRSFLNDNHLQGYISSFFNYGLFYEDELVSSLSFSKSRYNKNYDYEITRFSSKKGFNVIGGFSRLLKRFRSENKGSIITYADKRFSVGDVYRKNGFSELKNSIPNYFYFKLKSNELHSRLKFQKHKLKNLLEDFDEELTERENMYNNGWRVIWDCGNSVFVLS